MFLGQLPCHAELVGPVNSRQEGAKSRQDGEEARRFEADFVLAAEMQFRMQLLSPCISLCIEARVPQIPMKPHDNSVSRYTACHPFFHAMS